MLHFIAGLPRSGSTLLCNILAQRADAHVTPTSPLPGVVRALRDNWRAWHQSQPDFDRDAALGRVVGGVLFTYHGDRQGVVFDKNRVWPALIETTEHALRRSVRIVATVRPLEDVAASMEMVWRRNVGTGRVPAALSGDPEMQTTAGRVRRWLHQGDVIGSAISILGDAFARGLGDRIHLVDYRDLTANPERVIRGIESFLGLPEFEHRFDAVGQCTVEDDEWHGYSGLHQIRPVVQPQESRAVDVLGEGLAAQLRSTIYPWS